MVGDIKPQLKLDLRGLFKPFFNDLKERRGESKREHYAHVYSLYSRLISDLENMDMKEPAEAFRKERKDWLNQARIEGVQIPEDLLKDE